MLLADLGDQYLKSTGLMREFQNMFTFLYSDFCDLIYVVLGRSDDQIKKV